MDALEEHAEHPPYPVRIEGELEPEREPLALARQVVPRDPALHRALFLWLALFVLTVVAFFAILFTGRYPRGIFTSTSACSAGRGASRSTPTARSGRIATRRSRSTTCRTIPRAWTSTTPSALARAGARQVVAARDPAVHRRRHLHRWRRMRRGAAPDRPVGSGRPDRHPRPHRRRHAARRPRYPRGIFDLVMGLNRWVFRVAAYVLLKRDEYPPFRLDQGGTETSAPTEPETPPAPEVAEQAAEPATLAEERRGGGTVGKVVLIVVGVIAGVIAFGLLAGGCALDGRGPDAARRRRLPHVADPGLRDADVRDRVGERRASTRTERARWSTSCSTSASFPISSPARSCGRRRFSSRRCATPTPPTSGSASASF